MLPFLYTIIVGPLTPYIQDNGKLNFLAMVPVRWPILLLDRLNTFPFENELALVLYVIGCNVFFYGSLIYFALFVLSRREKTSPLPPAPRI